MPLGATSIADGAFQGERGPESARLPPGLTHVDTGAFEGCDALQDVEFPHTLVYVGDSAFARCEALRELYLPWALGHVGYRAFAGCARLERVEHPRVWAGDGGDVVILEEAFGDGNFDPPLDAFTQDWVAALNPDALPRPRREPSPEHDPVILGLPLGAPWPLYGWHP